MPRALSAENVRRKETVKTVAFAGADSQPSGSSSVPSAGAVKRDAATNTAASPVTVSRQEVTAALNLFRSYDEQAEDAAHLLIGQVGLNMPEDGGSLISVLSGKQSQKMVVYMVDKAVRRVALTGFTFDLLVIMEALIRAAVRGLEVVAVFDTSHALKGATTFMVDRLSALRNSGVCVLLSHGVSGESGIQHSKTVLADELVLIGSCNWTSASKLNHEIDVLLSLNEVGLAAYDERIGFIKRRAVPFSDDMERAGRQNRKDQAAARKERQQAGQVPRHKSVPAHDRYRTAMRFSVANARARSLGLAARSTGSQPSGSSSVPTAGAAQEEELEVPITGGRGDALETHALNRALEVSLLDS